MSAANRHFRDAKKESLQGYSHIPCRLPLEYYGVDTFALCEMNSYVLITQPVYEDIHPNLITIPLQTDFSMPYGLVYAKEPTNAADKFIQAVKAIVSENQSSSSI